jgi:hypothetical protein
MAGVDPGRAALVTQPYSIAVEDTPGAPGKAVTIVLALADQGGAEAYLGRIFPLAGAGLAGWPLTVYGGAGKYELGDEVTLAGDGHGPAADGTYIVLRAADHLMSGDADLIIQGPKPEED